MDKDRAKKLDTVFSQIEKQFGEGSLMKLNAGVYEMRQRRDADGWHSDVDILGLAGT